MKCKISFLASPSAQMNTTSVSSLSDNVVAAASRIRVLPVKNKTFYKKQQFLNNNLVRKLNIKQFCKTNKSPVPQSPTNRVCSIFSILLEICFCWSFQKRMFDGQPKDFPLSSPNVTFSIGSSIFPNLAFPTKKTKVKFKDF